MKVHNLMEEFVAERVNLLYDQLKEENPSWLTCQCEDCRTNAMGYVLNHIQPYYVVSERGISHAVSDIDKNQIRADIDALALEAIRTINAFKRPYHQEMKQQHAAKKQPSFNFPIFVGSVYDGATFKPLPNATVTLKHENKIIDMLDKTWSNPCNTYASTKGVYSFWVKSLTAHNANENNIFTFTIEVTAEDYIPINYAFNVPLVSEDEQKNIISSSYSLKIQDLFLFHKDVENPME
ncbi:MAG: late competence development ComFB family protein [Treponema sp.]|nr:late competence development ComFB family protein [Treponema sp.]